MEGMEEKLGAILQNPQMMQQIMTMAQALGQSQGPEKTEPAPQKPQPSPIPDIDAAMLQKLSGLARQGGVDRDAQALLNALCPFLSRERIQKLERAIRAAKLARLASTFLGQRGDQFNAGR